MEKINHHNLAEALIKTAKRAGQVQLEIYNTDFQVDYKEDNSPVSQADILSEEIILADLAKLAPNIPVLAEEAVSAGIKPVLGDQFFCVDPLDGTKEFVQKNDEFTVNIALIERGVPVFGLVYAPALHQLYFTRGAGQAFSCKMKVDDPDVLMAKMDLTKLATRPTPSTGLSVAVSRSHLCAQTTNYLKDFDVAHLKAAGSSLKFCLIAAGDVDLYPRFTSTMAWDSAAGHAIVLGAGGAVFQKDGTALRYDLKADSEGGEVSYLNPPFIVCGDRDFEV